MGIGSAIGGAASAASQAVGMAEQISYEKQARELAMNTSNEVAPTVTNAGTTANNLLSNYASTGNSAINALSNGLTESQLQATPGYKFQLGQGEQAATNASAARGLANSGAAEKAASTYANGLADSTYQNQFDDTNALAQEGYNALNQEGQNTIGTTENAANIKMSGAGAGVSALAGTGSAYQNGLTSLGSTLSQYGEYANKLLGNL